MRLPESDVRQALVHPDRLARQAALDYFADAHSRDAEVMPLVIRAVETFGRGRAFRGLYGLADLIQTEATVEWAVRELHRREDAPDERENYFPSLSRLLCGADLRLVAPRADEILRAPGFSADRADGFRERLELVDWGAGRCWAELERISADGATKPDASGVEFGRAALVVEALARHGEGQADRLLELLARPVRDSADDPAAWMEIFLAMLAGEMRLGRAVPLLVQKLRMEGEMLSEECVTALAKIGTDAAAEEVVAGWRTSSWDYRLYASGALEKIHSDATVRACLELLADEKDADIRTNLADALLSQLAPEGLEPILAMVRRGGYDPSFSDVKGHLVAAATVLGQTFPEYVRWKRQVEEEQARIDRKTREWLSASEAPPPREPPAARQEWRPQPIIRGDRPVGRNDPCPCGSGKKYKKCCLNRDKV